MTILYYISLIYDKLILYYIPFISLKHVMYIFINERTIYENIIEFHNQAKTNETSKFKLYK